jgi:hypothetical protein
MTIEPDYTLTIRKIFGGFVINEAGVDISISPFAREVLAGLLAQCYLLARGHSLAL